MAYPATSRGMAVYRILYHNRMLFADGSEGEEAVKKFRFRISFY